jgi:16S rRNA (cytidine1402-2'-O)-methyltransferase
MLRLERGDKIALVSDAGTPGISDPGHVLITAAYSRGVAVDALPGANAILPALLMSGIPAREFFFAGFAGGEGEISSRLAGLSRIRAALVFFVAPHDLPRFLREANAALGCRQAALVREISKVHQESIRGTLPELAGICGERELKGEMVVVVDAAETNAAAPETAEEWRTLALEMKKAGIWDKMIANVLFASYGIPRNKVKNFLSREALGIEHEQP